MCISCTDNFGIIQSQPAAAEISSIENPAVKSESIEKNYEINVLGPCGISSLDFVNDKNIPGSDTGMENTAEENISEDTAEEQGQTDGGEIKEENDNPGQNEIGDIDFSNSDNFTINVDLNQQKVFIYYKDNLIREMICSGGTVEKPTPEGEFKTTQKGEYFWSGKYSMGAYYWIRFYNVYLFHSVPFDNNNQMIKEEYDKLGNPASHGCIRLELEEAMWLYEMLPLGVKVLIY